MLLLEASAKIRLFSFCDVISIRVKSTSHSAMFFSAVSTKSASTITSFNQNHCADAFVQMSIAVFVMILFFNAVSIAAATYYVYFSKKMISRLSAC